MLFPLIPPYCLKSMQSLTISSNHITTKCSVTLLKNGVSDIGLKSSSDIGIGILLIGVTHSCFHCAGHSPVLTILLIILFIGVASSGENSFVIRRGRSPGTPECGFFAHLIFSNT